MKHIRLTDTCIVKKTCVRPRNYWIRLLSALLSALLFSTTVPRTARADQPSQGDPPKSVQASSQDGFAWFVNPSEYIRALSDADRLTGNHNAGRFIIYLAGNLNYDVTGARVRTDQTVSPSIMVPAPDVKVLEAAIHHIVHAPSTTGECSQSQLDAWTAFQHATFAVRPAGADAPKIILANERNNGIKAVKALNLSTTGECSQSQLDAWTAFQHATFAVRPAGADAPKIILANERNNGIKAVKALNLNTDAGADFRDGVDAVSIIQDIKGAIEVFRKDTKNTASDHSSQIGTLQQAMRWIEKCNNKTQSPQMFHGGVADFDVLAFNMPAQRNSIIYHS